jgi:hypothetical protein
MQYTYEAERRRFKTRLDEALIETTPDSRPMISNLHQQKTATVARAFAGVSDMPER